MRNKLMMAAAVAAGGAALAASVSLAATPQVPKTVKISARNVPGLGKVLVSSSGRTLYVFAPDKGKRVTCGPKLGCDLVWPPEFISPTGKPVAGSGVKQSLLSSAPDHFAPGKNIVTYKGWPLYLYKGDHKNGTAVGQATKGSGGLWWVITPTGQIIKHKPTSGGTGTTPTTTSPTGGGPVSLCPPGTTDADGDGDQTPGGVDDGDGCL